MRRNVRIGPLAADLFLPVGAPPAPTIITLLPYRRDTFLGAAVGEGVLRPFAAHGFPSLLVDMLGTGSSDGDQRPPFDPGEVDDAIAAMAWAAAQPWCDGRFGMWGHSYGACTTLRTASRQPPGLEAIIPVQGMLDPERDLVNPDGIPALLDPLHWGAITLLSQLLPPLEDRDDPEEQGRWRSRIRRDPYIVDVHTHRPGDPVWRERAIDASSITAPALVVAGWRDLFCDGSIRAFEQMAGPKHLIVGPWAHTMPQVAPVAGVDFVAVALRWWDHWLRGSPLGLGQVTLYVEHDGWRQFGAWPPPSASGPSEARTSRLSVAGSYEPCATIGIHSGLAGTVGASGVAVDQRDDDARALIATIGPFPSDWVLCGRPTVRVVTSPPVERVIVQLTDVDPSGTSTLVTFGASIAPDVTLRPTAYRVRAGHHLRVVISDAQFPRLAPPGRSTSFVVTSLDVTLPCASSPGSPAAPPPAPAVPEPLARLFTAAPPTYEVTDSRIEIGTDEETTSPTGGSRVRLTQKVVGTDGRVRSDLTAVVSYVDGTAVTVAVSAEAGRSDLRVRGQIDGEEILRRSISW